MQQASRHLAAAPVLPAQLLGIRRSYWCGWVGQRVDNRRQVGREPRWMSNGDGKLCPKLTTPPAGAASLTYYHSHTCDDQPIEPRDPQDPPPTARRYRARSRYWQRERSSTFVGIKLRNHKDKLELQCHHGIFHCVYTLHHSNTPNHKLFGRWTMSNPQSLS
jgi:hypothetical protein